MASSHEHAANFWCSPTGHHFARALGGVILVSCDIACIDEEHLTGLLQGAPLSALSLPFDRSLP